MIHKASLLLLAAALFAGSAQAQTTPVSPFDKQLARIDIGVQGVGEFNKTVSGPIIPPADDTGQVVTDVPSNTFGALVTVRYIARPWFGLEGNYGYARYTENFSHAPYGTQTKATEETLGYVATPPHQFLGLQPYIGAGVGTTKFTPTPHGGEGLPFQYRATYYWNAGVQQEYLDHHFGLRLGVRQLIFLAPDFGQNYLTFLKHTTTFEPGFGFYFRF